MISLNKHWIYWSLVVLWCAAIYSFTASPYSTGETTSSFIRSLLSIPPETVQEVNYLIRKGAHIASFGFLAVLILVAFRKRKYAPVYAWVLATLYGAVDEYHQSFTPGRTSLPSDVIIDSVGSLTAILLYYFIRKLLLRVNS